MGIVCICIIDTVIKRGSVVGKHISTLLGLRPFLLVTDVMCCWTERNVTDEETPSAIAECDTDTTPATTKCDSEDATTSNGADLPPAAVPPSVDDANPSHPDTDTIDEPASCEQPATSDTVPTTEASPSHGNDADSNSDSVSSLLTDADTCGGSSQPLAAGD